MVVLAVFIYFSMGLSLVSTASSLRHSSPDRHKQLQRERMVSSCLNLQQLATGYEKGWTQAETKLMLDNVPDSVLISVLQSRYERVKCGYVFNTACHAYMIDVLMAVEAADLPASVGPRYEESVRLMIVTLYNGGVRRMDGLWMMYLHLHRMNGSTARFAKANAFVLQKLEQLAKRSKCDALNEFNAFNRNSACRRKLNDAAGRPEAIARLIEENADTVSQIIAVNQTIGLDTTDADYFRADALYFNHVLADEEVLDELLGAYDVQVNRTDIKAALASRYEKARQLDLSVEGTAPLEAYQLAVVDTLKMILLRMVWKYVMLLNVKTSQLDFIGGRVFSKPKDYNNVVILQTLDWFANYFGLQHDRQFLNVYKRLSRQDTDSAVKALLEELTRISSTLACTVTEKPQLGSTVFDSNQMPVTSYPLIGAKLYQSVIDTDEDISKCENPFSKTFRNILDVCLKHKITIHKILNHIKPLSEIDEKDLISISLYVFQHHVRGMFKDIHFEMIRSFQIFSEVDYQSDENISQLEPEIKQSEEEIFKEMFDRALWNE
ncbi:uncharacterized protein LOC126833610 [Adelges cooleyi]|uniref:uncharacterized protein LOC126833610 n=1 Tax=Adelges cooleyi TaxID=133065 RepID=UPI00217F37C5|nr:uncharacterized protein LOC126833610 [Adelges cooleyi]